MSIPATLRLLRVALSAGAVLALAACGGGGGGGGGAGPAPATNQAPTASFTVSTADGFAPLDVTFDASASSDRDGTIAVYRWTFGDGDSAEGGPVISHRFTDTGTFSVQLTVSDNAGAAGATSRNVRVRGANVSGQVQIARESAVDSDVNDRFTPTRDNNSFGSAQSIRNPTRLGGFVNLPDTGSDSGNFRQSGDPEDFYRVTLLGNERIVLSIGDPEADLDLELYDDANPPQQVDASISLDPSEDVTAPPLPGDYFVRVVAVTGASNYVLSISDGLTIATERRRAKRLTDAFVPGEVLSASGRRPVSRSRVAPDTRAGRYRLARSHVDDRLPDLTLPPVPLAAGATASAETLARYRTLLAVKALHRTGTVEVAEPNLLRQPLRAPDDEFYPFQWHYPDIELEQAWDITTGQDTGHPPVVVAVVDTGVLLDHPDLRNQWLRDNGGAVVGYDFIQDAARANDGDGLDPDPSDPGDSAAGPDASSFHGSHVAGTVAAESDNAVGVAGVSWGARLMPLRALGIGGGTTYDVMQAVRYAARLSNASGQVPPVRADIVNLSLGSDLYSESEQRTFNEVRAQGVLVVASAGNSSSDVPSYPASYDGVVSVSASTITRTRAPYSNFGPLIDVAAPGGDVRFDVNADGEPDGVASTLGSGGPGGGIEFAYGILQGTSMAAPHVAGVMALMKSIYPTLTPAEFDALLADGQLTDDAGLPGRDDVFGHGIINARRAVQAAAALQAGTGTGIGAVLSVSAGTLNFQAFTRSLDFSVSNLGDESVSISVSGDQPWLSVSPLAASGDGLGPYRATVERAGLVDGNYAAVITIQPDDGSVTPRSINVLMRVSSPDDEADAGQHYVLLVSADGSDAVALDVVNVSSGIYDFRIDDVPPGEYRLFAGTDLDDDDFICDGGEACGAFPSLAEPALIVIDGAAQPEVEGLTFASEFRTTATTTGSAPAAAATLPDEGIRHRVPRP
ncbi:MAG: S8 family serine peptidase [bacterium]